MNWWLRAAFDVVLPRVCPPCGCPLPAGASSPLCEACRDALVDPAMPCCPCCGGAPGAGARRCAPCLGHPPAFETARALGPYVAAGGGNVLARTVQHLKYREARVLAGPLADLLAARYPFGCDAVLVPVPLHRTRLRARGYNQALLLARGLARRLDLALAPRLLERTRATAEHASLSAAARRVNVQGAFRARPGCRLGRPTVVLVDDVLTTGATADACARVLRAAGARTVHVYTIGRAA